MSTDHHPRCRRPRRLALHTLAALLLAGCNDSSPAPPLDSGPFDATALERNGADALAGEGPAPLDCSTAGLVARVSATRLLADLEALTGLGERTTEAGQARAAEFLAGRLSPLGLEVRKLSYSHKTGSFANLEATLPGELADRFVFVGAHYDAVTGSPGADDDASGTVAVLEMARALAGCKLRRTVRFLFFSNEEQGAVGSSQYVKALASAVQPSQLIAYLSLDMIGYARAGESLDVASRPAHAALVEQVADAVTRWSSLLVKRVVNDQCG